MIFKEHIKDVGYCPVFSGGELRDLGINPKSTGKGILYTWNANGSLRSVTDLQGTTYRFRYDAFGRRLEKRRMASTFRFVWDGNVLLHETFKKDNSENTELTTWVFEGFVPTAKLVNGKAYSIISDHLGTPILAVDSDGMEVWNRQLDIYGRVRKEYKHSSLGDDVFPFVPFLYQGQYYDFETGLCYNRFRYYSPETGAYISQDPIGLAGGNPTLYGYVFDPNSWIDPLGLSGRGGALHQSIQKQLQDDLEGLGKNVGTEGQIKLKNDKSRFGDVVVYADDKKQQILEVHQIGDMRTRGGFRPSSRERGAIMDIREALGDNVRIVFHDKKGRVTLIDPDKADDWKEPSKKHRKNSC
ncbi:RHS repeat domain-containing protein [Capnocytophaga gingivalis]|uniref:RHS repeat-associated core domain-containing protein n=1 Tax=Capnocytophaga gingivalis TaxID=1017 RepID=A0ABU5YDK5_9FLAO|nr:RHS repeat-associated core domain-containing protein [Capnocytophaga gingivalis]MEB3041876.1 RHS repeat-associated core domain-containing protein [Capnocytophaga gingivalis]